MTELFVIIRRGLLVKSVEGTVIYYPSRHDAQLDAGLDDTVMSLSERQAQVDG